MRCSILWLAVVCLLALPSLPIAALSQAATPSAVVLERLQASPTGTPAATPVSLEDAKDFPPDAASLAALPGRDDNGFRVSTGAIEIAVLLAVVVAVIAGTTYTWRHPRDG